MGNMVWVAGTTATGQNGEIIGKGDAYQQTIHALSNIEYALKRAGASLEDVIRTRMFVTNITKHWEDVGQAHGDFFREIRPVATMVEVRKLSDPDMLVEIEVEAYISVD
jgi:enamine deaminase RidA (YjgF/YER057c/UK114 family)